MAEDFHVNQTLLETPAIVSTTTTDTSRKRKRPPWDTVATAYSSVSFVPWKLAGGKCRPDSPHFFFSSSYRVMLPKFDSDEEVVGVDDSITNAQIDINQVVHQHANGLCMVTAGELSIPPSKILRSIQFVTKEAPSFSNAEKRKRQTKMLKGRGKVDHVVSPSTIIAELLLEDRNSKVDTGKPKTTTIPLRACVWGTLLELNSTTLSPDILVEDPLLDGL